MFPSVLFAKNIFITVHPVIETDIEDRIETVGKIESLQSPVVAAELTARVLDIKVKIGDFVTKDTLLAQLDSASYDLQLKEAQAEVRRLTSLVKLQTNQVIRYRALLRKKGVDRSAYDKVVSENDSLLSQLDYAKAKASAAELRVKQTQIYSPIEGVIDERMIFIGSYVSPGTPLFKVVEVNQLRVRLPFSERLSSQIKIGQTVYLHSEASSGTPIKAKINYLRPQIEANSLAIEVFANFENNLGWLPGASVKADLILQKHPNSLIVPEQAIVQRPIGQVVYVVHSQAKSNKVKIEERLVVTGLVSDKGTQIVSGLKAGEVIALDGARFLSAGAKVEIQR
ncbi:MexH family multidrug efflux RND transporter periplasmic adaptor subunit [Thiomicrorhabdus immobilis]|uniref:MexH family multidrug efflux RND transporter periplasmic adaptor subunit n=2 Tax=Thiomicrorhabdus immobilis TaxID=2791037 RepID=A0ABM7MFQ5_9GAMM|nr:MexH family multidrug efflux RND transporter periplasmic adaptor subunit [Thiomicrorhabdus immobilis]